jgi:hypothetical protein
MTRETRFVAVVAVAALAAGIPACSETTLPNADARVPQTIIVVPRTVKLTLADGKVQAQRFRAFAYYDSSVAGADLGALDDSGAPAGGVELTDTVTWSVELESLGRFVDSEFRTEVEQGGAIVPALHGGASRVVARVGGMTGYASIEVAYTKSFFADKAPKDADTKFGGAAKAAALSIYYPPTGVLVPPNLGQMEIQYSKGGATNDLFRIRLNSPLTSVTIYTTEPSHNLTPEQWQAVGLSSRGEEVKVIVDGTVAATPASRSVSKTHLLKIAESQLKGGLYYWVVSRAKAGETKEDEGIYRYSFDAPTPTAEAYYTNKEAKDCVGCHALSRGGEYVAFTKSGGNGNTAILDVKQRVPVIDSKYRGDIQTFSPDGQQVIVVYKGALTRRKVSTGEQLEVIPTGQGKATHPDWSADGNSLVFVRVKDADYWKHELGHTIDDDVHFRRGSVVLLTRSGSQWSSPKVLVASSGNTNNYYPSFSPGGDWIVFNRSTGDSYSDVDATIYTVRSSGKGLRALSRLNAAKMSNSWPRWAPFVQKYNSTTIYWLTFSSVRNYGVKLLNSKLAKHEDKAPQVWMTSFDTQAAAAGKDPTTPPFWLPFQDIAHHNHIAQWTERVLAIE